MARGAGSGEQCVVVDVQDDIDHRLDWRAIEGYYSQDSLLECRDCLNRHRAVLYGTLDISFGG